MRELIIKEAKMESEFRLQAGVEQSERERENVEEEKKQEFLRTKKDMEYNFKSLLRALERHPQDV